MVETHVCCPGLRSLPARRPYLDRIRRYTGLGAEGKASMADAVRRSRRLLYYRWGMIAGLALMLLAALGEGLGWWRDVGLVLGTIGLILTL